MFDFLKFWNRGRKDPRNFLNLPNSKSRFTYIYESNYWSGDESVSGKGSSLKATENIRNALLYLFEKHGIKTLFDAPCGDFNWMQKVVAQSGINYIGADIVETLVDKNNSSFSDPKTRFLKMDITNDDFPNADLWLCRHCLFHMSYRDIHDTLTRFLDSSIPLMLTTTNIVEKGYVNLDIVTGDFRQIDLFSAPFCFSSDVLFRTHDYVPPDYAMDICLWEKQQVADGLKTLQAFLAKVERT